LDRVGQKDLLSRKDRVETPKRKGPETRSLSKWQEGNKQGVLEPSEKKKKENAGKGG